MHPLINIAVKAAREAATIILRSIDRVNSVEVSAKGHHDFVTEIDKKAEAAIISTIQQAYPEHSILSEEIGLIKKEESDFKWIIDPLDGTANFIHGFPHLAVSIAVTEKDKLSHGVVYDPLRNEMFTASAGEGAQLNQRRIRVSENHKLDKALLGTGFPAKEIQHFKPYLRTFEAIFPKSLGVRRAGSAALDLAYVAAGRLDGFWEISLKSWDMAAGALLVKEAGGFATDLQGGDTYLESQQMIAGNPKIHKQLLQAIQSSLNG